MKLRVAERALARRLRAEGWSYSEIRQRIGPLSKGTLNRWLSDISLTPEQRQRLVEKARLSGEHGGQLGALANRMARERRVKEAHEVAVEAFPRLVRNPLFWAGIVLYCCEGSRRFERFAFVNSDPKLIRLMIKWLTAVCGVPIDRITARVYAHQLYDGENPEVFWRRLTGLPTNQFRRTIYKPNVHSDKKNLSYMGCCRLDVKGLRFIRVVRCWEVLLLDHMLSLSLGKPEKDYSASSR